MALVDWDREGSGNIYSMLCEKADKRSREEEERCAAPKNVKLVSSSLLQLMGAAGAAQTPEQHDECPYEALDEIMRSSLIYLLCRRLKVFRWVGSTVDISFGMRILFFDSM